MSVLQSILQNAAAKPGFRAVVDTQETIRRLTPEPQADMRCINLRQLSINEPREVGQLDLKGGNAVSRVASELIASHSRVLAAGAKLVLLPDAPQPVQDSKSGTVLVQTPGGLSVAEPAPFAKIAPNNPATDSPLPVYRSMLDRSLNFGGTATHAFRTVISRRTRHNWAHGQLDDALMSAIVQGLGSLVDRLLLTTIANQNPGEFSIAKAAARGLKFDDLSGIIGTAGAGAHFRGDGMLCAANVPAELSDATASTLVGAFHKAGLILHEDITLLAQRVNNSDDMAVTVLVSAESLLPVTGTLLPFWTVSA